MSAISKIIQKAWRATPLSGESKPLVTVVELNGVIGAAGPGRKGLSLARLEKTIEAAFEPVGLSAVALAVNSPGGSAVQSRLIYSKIRRLADEKKVPVLTFIEDVGASGGYILALAGDEIYGDESSIVGSIGVVAAGFGFQEAIARFGVERRVHTAGENKAMLDPFKNEDPEDVARLKGILDEIHQHFIDLVKQRRGDKLSQNDASGEGDTFSGAFWVAPNAKKRGLVDGIAQMGDFLRQRFGKDVKVKRLSPEGGSLLKRLLSSDAKLGAASLIDPGAIFDAAAVRALWARYGL